MPTPTREQYVAQRARWLAKQAELERERDELARMTHELLEERSAAEVAAWLAEDLDDKVGAHGVRHWDVRWHRDHEVPREHATVKPAV